MSVERTFVAIKPDGVERGLIGKVIDRFESRGLKLVGMKLMKLSSAKAEEHYGEHKGKPFFDGLVGFITSGPIVAMVWEGKGAIALARNVIGATNPASANPGSIRGDLAVDIGRNVVHGSDGPDSAKREISIFFSEAELSPEWPRSVDKWVAE
ncbi:MAG: nucleoside-diphosphate kinase [Candidatus Obscuribacterales bacterium]|nr:nucleoside-diphosphate kinase [Candidatus Obscuribacterales bacterium]